MSDQKQFRLILRERATAANIALSSEQERALEAYFDLLQRWNRRINLTALPLEPPTDAAIDRLIVEGIVAADALGAHYENWIDLGSGGGSPAIPMKIRWPENSSLMMVESKGRKSAFLREAIREIPLSKAAVAESRFEQFKGMAATADLVTVRAVKTDLALFQAAATLLKPGGHLATFGADSAREAAQFEPVASPTLPNGSSLVVYRRK